jgi:catechol 2,3-dioxygenase-like lactoylglutathione lyase family enzyme
MKPSMPGIHHITAICGDPQANVDFYCGLLGLRLVKKTVNFDDPGTYHLYYGNGVGSPGTIMTFFAWLLPPGVRANARQGTGQITATSFRIPVAAVEFWLDRFAASDVDFDGPQARFNEQIVSFADPDGLPLELVTREAGAVPASWDASPIPTEHAIRGFAGATLSLDGYERTAGVLTDVMGFKRVAEEGSRFRFQTGEGNDAAMIDLLCQPESEAGRMGIGAVHHIAWRTPSTETQLQWRSLIAAAGLDVSPVLDRNYFHSIYYREPGGVLFEIATDPPGFTVDESVSDLGTHLKLPPWLESRRDRLEAKLPQLRVPLHPRRTG